VSNLDTEIRESESTVAVPRHALVQFLKAASGEAFEAWGNLPHIDLA
jgi:hypothetical protein